MDLELTGQQWILLIVAFLVLYVLFKSARKTRAKNSLILLVMGAALILWLCSTIMMQSYTLGSGSDVLVAKVKASSFSNVTNQLSVDLTLYGKDGKVASDQTYAVKGNEWSLQTDVVKVSGLLTAFGLHSGFKLTRLEGRYDDPGLERTAKHTVVDLNGGNDMFFLTSQALNGFISPFIDSEYGSAVFAGSGTYNIYASQTTLWAKGA